MNGYEEIILDIAENPFALFLAWMTLWSLLTIVVGIPAAIVFDIRRQWLNRKALIEVRRRINAEEDR